MIQVIPKWQITIELDCDKPNTHTYIINANNLNECCDWIRKLNFGLSRINKLSITIHNEDKQEGRSY